MSNGPIVAPAWSSASFSPKTHPAPIDLPAYESIASTVGLRMPRPVRSATTKVAASGHRVASARAGTASRLTVYPTKANAQCRCDLSAKYPDRAQPITHELAKACDKPDDRRAHLTNREMGRRFRAHLHR